MVASTDCVHVFESVRYVRKKRMLVVVTKWHRHCQKPHMVIGLSNAQVQQKISAVEDVLKGRRRASVAVELARSLAAIEAQASPAHTDAHEISNSLLCCTVACAIALVQQTHILA